MKYTFAVNRPKNYRIFRLKKPRFGLCKRCKRFRKLVLFNEFCDSPWCDDIPF